MSLLNLKNVRYKTRIGNIAIHKDIIVLKTTPLGFAFSYKFTKQTIYTLSNLKRFSMQLKCHQGQQEIYRIILLHKKWKVKI